MTRLNPLLFSLSLATPACLALSVSGCQTYGEVRVGAPKVFSRSRVLRDRQREIAWLEGQLELAGQSEPSLQGLRDVREFESFYHSLRGTWDPTRAEALSLMRRRERNDQRIQIAQQQLTLSRLAKQAEHENLATVTSETGPSNVTAVDTNAGLTADKADPKPAAKEEPNKDLEALAKRVEKLESEERSAVGKLPEHGGQLTRAQFSFRDRFLHRKGNRELVLAAMREKQFDDAHDTWGSTLYDLRFSMTLVPGDSSSRFADLQVDILKSDPDLDQLYQDWRERALEDLKERQLALQQMLVFGGNLSARERFAVGFAIAKALKEAEKEEKENREEIEDRVKVLKQIVELAKQVIDKALEGLSDEEKEALTKVLYGGAASDSKKIAATQERVIKTVRAKVWQSTRDRDLLPRASTGIHAWRQDLRARKERAEAELSALLEHQDKVKEAIGRIAKWPGRTAFFALDLEQDDLYRKLRQRILKHVVYDLQEDFNDALGGSLSPLSESVSDLRRHHDGVVTLYVSHSPSGEGLEQARADARQAFDKLFERLTRTVRTKPRVLSVQPQEELQNLSEVSAKEKLVQLVLSLQATLPQGANVTSDNEYVNRKRTNLEAIRRVPLAVGYASQENTFGWVLGPEFRIEGSDLEFLHRPIKHSYTVSVSVPAWLKKLSFKRTVRWINSKGKPIKAEEVSSQMSCPLPGDFDQLTLALLRLGGQHPRPRLLDLGDGSGGVTPLYLQAGESATLLLRGRNLWKSPQVFLGSQKATRVEILADMRGVHATFGPIRAPVGPEGRSKSATPLPVTIKTSDGEDVLWRQVFVVPSAEPPALTPSRAESSGGVTSSASSSIARRSRLPTTTSRLDTLHLGRRPSGPHCRMPRPTSSWSLGINEESTRSRSSCGCAPTGIATTSSQATQPWFDCLDPTSWIFPTRRPS